MQDTSAARNACRRRLCNAGSGETAADSETESETGPIDASARPEAVCVFLEVKVEYAACVNRLLRDFSPDPAALLDEGLLELLRLDIIEETRDSSAAFLIRVKPGVEFFQPAEYMHAVYNTRVGVLRYVEPPVMPKEDSCCARTLCPIYNAVSF